MKEIVVENHVPYNLINEQIKEQKIRLAIKEGFGILALACALLVEDVEVSQYMSIFASSFMGASLARYTSNIEKIGKKYNIDIKHGGIKKITEEIEEKGRSL